MKLHLPLSLRSALLAVLALSPFSYASDIMRAEGGNIPDNPGQNNEPVYYVWGNNILRELRNAASRNDGYIYDTITFTLDDNPTREMNEDICFAGLVTLNLNDGIFNHKEGSFGRNADTVYNIAGGTYNMVDASSESFSTPEIGFGYGHTVTINLTGGNFVMNNMTAYIAREGAHAEITVGKGSTFTLQNGSIGYGSTTIKDEEDNYISKGSSVNLTVESGGKLVMSGGRIGTMTGSTVENHITIKSGGSFSMSGGAIGDTANMALIVESGGAWILSNGNFEDSRGTIHLSGSGVNGNGIEQGGNAALFVNGSVSTAIAMAVTLDDNTTYNVFSPQNSVTFSGQYTFGGHQLTKLGQGNLKFTGGFTTTDAGSISIQRGVVTLDYKDADALRDYEISMGWVNNAADPSPGLQLGSGSYVIRNLTNIAGSGKRATVYGSGTLVIDYSGTTTASTDAGMSGGNVSLEKRGSGTQILSGSIDALNITVAEGTLRLGSEGQSISLAGEVEVGGTLYLDSSADVGSLSGIGTIHAAGSLTLQDGGSTSLTLNMADGSTLEVQSGTFSADELNFGGSGSGTLTVSLGGDVKLDFGSINAASITLTLSDAEISSLGIGTYTLFENWNTAWDDIFTYVSETVGRNTVSFSGGAFTIETENVTLRHLAGDMTWSNSDEYDDWTVVGGDGKTDRFYNGDAVEFASQGGAVTLSGEIIANTMLVQSGRWDFGGTDSSLAVMNGLTLRETSANFDLDSIAISGGLNQESGSITFSGEELEISGGLTKTGGELTFSSASTDIHGAVNLKTGGTTNFNSTSTTLHDGLLLNGSTEVNFTGTNVDIRQGMSIADGSVTFSGTNTTITGNANITGGTVTFSGDNLGIKDNLSIGSGGTVILQMNGAAEATAANSPTLGVPATGRSLGKVTVAKGGKLVVYGFKGDTDTSYTWKQNTVLSTYTSVVGGGTLEFCDLGYQVLSGESINSAPDQYGRTSRGSSILFRFIDIRSNETALEKIHILELSTKNSLHATSLAFDRGDPANGWNPATALLKRIGEIHVNDGAALGFTAHYLRDENNNPDGIQSGAKVFETTHGVLHLAGTGVHSDKYNQGGNAALFVNSEDSLSINVSMPWDVVLDADTQINTFTSQSGITFTGEYDGGKHTLTKVGAGSMTFGSGFTTAQDSSGAIVISRGKLIFDYDTADALKNYDIEVKRFSDSEQTTLTLQGGSYAIHQLSGNGIVTGSGTLEFTLSEGTATFSSDIIATAEGERVSLKMSGAGEQEISGSVTAEEIIANNGTLILGTTTTNTLSGKGGNLEATGDLSIGNVAQGTSLSALSVAEGATLQIGGGTLKGDTLNLGDNATLKVCLEKGAQLDFATLNLGDDITLELLDLYLPDGISVGTPYQLFANWKQEYQGHIHMKSTQLGRSEVVFDDENGTITIQGADRADLVWDGDGTTWKADETLTNWTDSANAEDSFYNGDNVTFDTEGEHSIALEGDIFTGALTVQQGEMTLANAAEATFGVSGKLTIAEDASLTLNTHTTSLRGEVEVQSNATLTIGGATATLEEDITISGGTLNLSSTSTSAEGDITVASGTLSLSGGFTTSGAITLGQDGGTAALEAKGSAAKSLGAVEVNAGSTLVLYGADGNTAYASNYSGTSVSGSGALTLRNFGYNEIGADGGLLARFLSAENGIGQLRTDRADLTNNDHSTSLAFTAASAELDALLTGIGDISIGTGTAIGFAENGANAMANTSGTLHLSGTGTGMSDNYGTKGGNAALYVAGAIAAKLAWDIVLESNINVTPVAPGSSITLSGTLNGNNHTLTKNGQGSIITAESFNTANDSKGTLLWARGSISFGHTANPDAFKNYTLQMGYNSNAGQTGTLTLLGGGTYAVNKLVGQVNNNSADKRSAITGNGTLEIWSTETSTVYADITASEGGRVSLSMEGSGSQTISGSIVVEDITIHSGALILGGAGEGSTNVSGTVALNAGALTLQGAATLDTLATGAGSLKTSGNLSIAQAKSGTAAPSGNITVGGDLTLGGGTLKGGTLTLAGKLSISLAKESHLDFSRIDISDTIILELLDTIIPSGYGSEQSYRLFEQWDAEAMAGKIRFDELTIGRQTVTFNEETGAIEFFGDVGRLTWNTEHDDNTWYEDSDSVLNWNKDGSTADRFIVGDHVLFDDENGESIALSGSIFSGDVSVNKGDWTFEDTPDSENSLTIGGALVIENGASLNLSNASTKLASGTIRGTLSVAAGRGFTNSGAITIEDGGCVHLSSGVGSAAKTIGNAMVNKGGTLVIEGRETVYGNNYSGYLAKNTAEETLTAVSGEGTVELRGVYGYVWNSYTALTLGDDGGLLASLFPVTDSEAGKGKIGTLKLTEQTALSFKSASATLQNAISHINEIEVTEGSSLGFAIGSSNVLTGTTGTFRLAGNGTGRGGENNGKYGALFVTGEITVENPWNIVVDAAGAAIYIAPGDEGQNIMKLTGALTLDGAALTKLGNGNLELAEGFTTRAADGKTTDSGTIILGNKETVIGGGSLTLNYSDENALAGYVIALNHVANGSAQLLVYDTSASADSHRYRVKGISDDVTEAVDGKYASQNKRATIGGYGTLIIDTDETMSSQASIVGGNFNSAYTATLRLEKEGKGKQEILGNVIATSIRVNEGALTLGSSGKTVKVTDTLTVAKDASLNLGGKLTVGTLEGKGEVVAEGALTLDGDISAFKGTLVATDDDAQWELTGVLSSDTTVAAQLNGNISVAYTSAHDVTLSGGAAAGSTIAHAMTASEPDTPGALVLTGTYTDTTLVFNDNEMRLGSANAAGTWSGSLSGSGTFTLVNGSLGTALASEALGDVSLAVDAAGAVDVAGTAGSLLGSISIREGGSLSGVTGDISTAKASISLVLGKDNIGSSGSGVISSTGDLYITDSEKFSIGFSAEAFAELLKGTGEELYLQVLHGGGSIILDSDMQLGDILTSDYAQLLMNYHLVSAQGGSLVISGSAKEIYLVLADGSRDAAVITDYHALDERVATVVDENTTLSIELDDSPSGENTLSVNNLVGLKGSVLSISKSGQEPLVVVLNNADNGLKERNDLPGNLGPQDVRGIDTEFKGTILAGEGVVLRKVGAGTLYVGDATAATYRMARAVEGDGGLQVEGEVNIGEGAIVVRGKESEINCLIFDYNAPAASGEQRGFTTSGSCVTIHSIAEDGGHTSDNRITLENAGEVVLDGKSMLESTCFSAGTGGGVLSVAKTGELVLQDDARTSGVGVQVDGGQLELVSGATTENSDISVINGGSMLVGHDSGISGGNVDVQNGKLSLDGASEGIRTKGSLNIGDKGVVDLARGASSSVGRLFGSGELRSDGRQLNITGSGSEFSGTLGGNGGSIYVAQGASFTLKDAATDASATWDTHVQSGGSFTVDIEASSRKTHLGDITLEDNASFIYKYDTGRSSNLTANIVLQPEAQASFTVFSDGAEVDPDRELILKGMTFTGDMDKMNVNFKGKAFVHYRGDAQLQEGNGGLVVKVQPIQGNNFLVPGMQKNAQAGAVLFWDAFNTQGAVWKYMQKNPFGDLMRFTDELYARYDSGQNMSSLLAAGAGAATATLSAALQEDVRRQVNALRNRTASLAEGKTPGEISAFWLNAETNYLKQKADGLAPGYTLNGWGASAGMDVMTQPGVHVGLSLAAMYNDLKVSSADSARGDLDTTYLGAYARVAEGAWMHTFILTGGSVDASLNRTVNYGSGSYTTHGETDGYTFAAMYELGYSMLLSEDGDSAMQMLAGIQYRHTMLNSYAEDGSDAGLCVSNLAADVVTFSMGARYMTLVGEKSLNLPCTLELRSLLKADLGDRAGKARTALLMGSRSAEVESAEMGAIGIELGAGLSLPISTSGTYFLETSAEFRAHYTNVNAATGIKLQF